VDQAAAATSRVALGLLEQPRSDASAAGSRRQPEQLYVALAPVRLQDQSAQQPSFAIAHAHDLARVAERSRLPAVEPHQPVPQLARNSGCVRPFDTDLRHRLSVYSPAMSWIDVVLFAVIVILGIAIWSIKRHKDPHLRLESDMPIEDLLPSISGMALGMETRGNAVEIFQNGAFFDALLEDIGAARHTVHFETFLWKDGKLGRRMAQAFCRKAREGLTVRMTLDAQGCKKIGKEVLQQMRDAGCHVALYHRKTLKNLGVIPERDHRKITVVDGRVAWVGGHCIVDEWLGNAQDRHHVRDLSVRLRGPVVHAVQSAFGENWVETTGQLFVGEHVFPPLDAAGEVISHMASLKPEGSAPAVKILHHVVLCCARKRLWIQNPYFIPEPDAVDAFAAAVRRGVDVQVMVPSTDASDMPFVQHAAHHTFQKLLDCGVRIFEYQRCLLHQKVMTVDGVWCAVGSSNFDDRSFETNDEITLGFLDGKLAARLEEIFRDDLKLCRELQAAQWKKRGLLHRAKDSAAYLFNEVL
jgi:cardiolipin synthase